MNTHIDQTQENKSQSVANAVSPKQNSKESTFQFVDNCSEAIAQRKLQEMVNNSPQVSQLMAFQDMANNSPQAKQTVQLQSMVDNYAAQQLQPIQKKENNTGLPDTLKTGMENLSGMSLDDVKVHRNSDKPAQLQAHAYAQGTDIHLSSGQEKYLPHEAWHVVQQKQGRVKPTMQMKGKVNVNNDVDLEKEADVMGQKALQTQAETTQTKSPNQNISRSITQLAFNFNNSWVPGMWWKEQHIEKEKQSLNEGIDALILKVNKLKEHHYYKHLNTFENSERQQAFNELKRGIDKIHTTVHEKDNAELDWGELSTTNTFLSLNFEEASALNTRFSGFSGEAETQSTNEKKSIGALESTVKKMGTKKLDGFISKTTAVKRSQLSSSLSSLQSSEELIGNTKIEAERSKVTSISNTYDDAGTAKQKKIQEDAAKRKKERELQQTEKREQEQKEEALFAAYTQKIEKAREKTGNSYNSLFKGVGGDIDLLLAILEFVPEGEVGQLNSFFGFTDFSNTTEKASFLYLLANVKTKDLNKFFAEIRHGKAPYLQGLVDTCNEINADADCLLSLIKATKANAKLASVIQKYSFDEIETLLSQTENNNLDTVIGLLAPSKVKTEDVKTLLASASKADVLLLLDKLRDTETLLKLQTTVSDALELKLLVIDLAEDDTAASNTKSVIGAKDPTKEKIYNKDAVKKTRGLKTDAGATIPTMKLGTDEEGIAIKATLDHIRGGEQPTLSHSSGAKFGDTFNNKKGGLPGEKEKGGYKEYYVEKNPLDDLAEYHGSRRLVVSNNGRHIYYTSNHYTSFKRLLV